MKNPKLTIITVELTLDEDFSEYKDPDKKAFNAVCGAIMGGSFIRNAKRVGHVSFIDDQELEEG